MIDIDIHALYYTIVVAIMDHGCSLGYIVAYAFQTVQK